jgi:hypothetical protein
VFEPSFFEVEMSIEKPKSHSSPGIDQIRAELIKAGGITIRYEGYKRFNSLFFCTGCGRKPNGFQNKIPQ